MKNVCIVGYGAVGEIHAAAISKIESAAFFAVCDIDAEKCRRCSEEYGVLTYSDFDLMLENEEIDCLHICTPHYLHFEMIKKALKAGKSVVCEKPVTMTENEFKELLTLENAEKVCVVFQNRFNASIKKFKEIADSKRLGTVKCAKAFLTWKRDEQYYRQQSWRGRWETEGGGLIINQAIHTLDFFCFLADEICSVKAQMSNFSIEGIEVEDTCAAHLNIKNGAIGVFYATNSYGENSPPQFEVVFENGTLRYIDNMLYLNGSPIEQDLKSSIGKSYWGASHIALLKSYYDKNEFYSPFDVKNTMMSAFALYKSAKQNGANVNVE